MTTEQMALVKKLIQKHEIEATDAEWTLIFMGVLAMDCQNSR